MGTITWNKPVDPRSFIMETDRLIIRPFTQDDIEPSYLMNLDAEVSKYTGDGGVLSREEIHHRISDNVLGDYEKYGFGRLAVELKDDGKFIGFAGLKYLDYMDEVDLGYRLMRAHWGKGLATESCRACLDFGFNILGLDSIIAMVLPENTASINVLNKLGFKFEKEVLEDGELAQLFRLKKD